MGYWRCYYHIVWATKYRRSCITSPMEQIIFQAIERKCKTLGCELLAINGVTDHVHVAMTIPPAQSVATVIGQIKAISSKEINETLNLDERFEWQTGYGVLTFGEKVIPHVLEYIAKQKEHHQLGTYSPYLEYMDL